MKRNTAREIVIQLLFSTKYSEIDENLFFTDENFSSLSEECDLYSEILDDASRNYILKVLRLYCENETEVNNTISKNLNTWSIDRISSTALAVLKCSITEILFMNDIPAGASINSAVEIAKKYDEPDVVSFINGVLGSVAKHL